MSWIYVAGPFRSGSTVVGELLASRSGGVHIGESHHVWRSLTDNELCSCGCRAGDCPFWNDVRTRLEDLGAGDAGEAWRLRRQVASNRGAVRPLQTSARQRYQHYMDALVSSVTTVAAGRCVVDTGKLAGSLPYLQRATSSLRVLYLYRDGSAVVNSWRHAKPDPSKPSGTMHTKSTARALVELVGTEMALLFPRPRVPLASLRYEVFVEQPERAISSALEALGVGYSGSVVAGQSHVLAGNPARFNRTETDRVVSDDRYRTELTGLRAALVRLGTRPAELAFRLLERRAATE